MNRTVTTLILASGLSFALNVPLAFEGDEELVDPNNECASLASDLVEAGELDDADVQEYVRDCVAEYYSEDNSSETGDADLTSE